MLICFADMRVSATAATSTVRFCFHSSILHVFIVYLRLRIDAGAYIVNNARGAICDHGAIVRACESGQIGGALLLPPSLPG